METDLLFQKLNANKIKENIAILKDEDIEIQLEISKKRYLCVIKANAPLSLNSNKKSEDILKCIKIMNNIQDGVVYDYDINGLKVKAALWYDKAPTYQSLQDMINLTIAGIKSAKNIIENGGI